MKPGTIIKLPDGRIGTVVYHGLDGYGIIWGAHTVPVEKILETCPLFSRDTPPEMLEYEPQAMLREPYTTKIECVGEEYEIIEETK